MINKIEPTSKTSGPDTDVDLRKVTLKEEASNEKNLTIMEKVAKAKRLKSFAKGATLASQDANSLEGYEAENDERHWSRHIKQVVTTIIFVALAI